MASSQLKQRIAFLTWLLFCIYLWLSLAPLVSADEHNHVYEDGEEVVVWMNTVGPYHNRQETYSYFSLPFCRGPKEGIAHYHETLGEAFQGVELELAGLDIDFNMPVRRTTYCRIVLTEDTAQQLIYAVQNQYWYQLFIDDLPVWGIVGEVSESDPDRYYLWTHKRFQIGINNGQIVDVNLTSAAKRLIRPGARIAFSYEVIFRQSDVPFDKRFDKYLDPSFFHHHIHWFSLCNSFAMAAFLVCLVAFLLTRLLRRDYSRYSRAEESQWELERSFSDEFGWKQVYGDVFRPPAQPTTFSILVGSGVQLSFVVLCLILLAMSVDMNGERAGLVSAAIFLYSASSPIGGFVGAALYSRFYLASTATSSSSNNGQAASPRWIRQGVAQALLPPSLICGVAFPVNLVAVGYHSSRSLTPSQGLSVLAIVTFALLPLSLIGTLLGRNLCGRPSKLPCRLNAVPRPLPEKRHCLAEPPIICLLGGLLPFASIFVEMYYVFTSFWAYKIYYVYGFSFLAFALLLCATACVTIVCVYFLLNSEDYRWQWCSFMAGASTAVYLYVYAVYYFFFKTRMYGLYQTAFYFSFMALFCCGLALICGAVGFLAASLFVRTIYANVKTD
ncbi:hypothetical protein BOX15_Mlig000875g4 [Macrostomum lignano]|uniref:Transmembrane 9 superfamily member n=2 Tax=Macrostomum lignano TaxID=282301 RepID=A0A1I8J5C2_9PLAT|nr:hypothetical protein BOX15_Mlig000875g4 [Macrostomum lignano]